MNRKNGWIGVLLVFAMVSCGGEGPGLAGGRGGAGTDDPDDETPPVAVDSVELLASSPQLQSDGSNTVTLTALLKDENNQVMADVPVVFSASSGSLAVIEEVTNAQGVATAELTPGGDPTNRGITASATAGTLTSTVDIAVIGTSIQVQGPASLGNSDTGTYTITLADSGGAGIADETVSISSANGNTLSATNMTTDVNGRVTITVTGTAPGTDTLTVSALGNTVSATASITVSSDNFGFDAPATGTEINLAPSSATVTVHWEKDGVAQAGEIIRFATTRGTVDDPSDATPAAAAANAVTNASGQASVIISSTTSGSATITATNDEDTATQRSIEFVATNPNAVSLQADPAVIGVNESSTITAVVRNGSNLVKNAHVEFSVQDNVNGSLSVASAVTDSQGRAQTVYTASSTTSADNGVVITGTVVEGTSPSATTNLTVSGRALFINFGTGNTIVENATDTSYTKDYVIMVTDASGKGVANQTVTISALPDIYRKGVLGTDPVTDELVIVLESICGNEDQEPLNGVLDAGEDANHSEFPEDTFGDLNADGENNRDPGWGVLEPGNRALISPGTVVTDENGLAEFQLIYPQDHALWLDVIITAKATVAGTESKRSQRVVLQMSADDEDNPPNAVSPFGTDYFYQANCTDEEPATNVY